MFRMIKIFLIMLVAAAALAQQDPNDVREFVVGRPYLATGIFCELQKDAVDLAKAYLERGKAQYLAEGDKAKYHGEAGVAFFIVVRQVAVFNKGKQSVYVIEILSDRLLYLVTNRKVISAPPPSGEGQPDDEPPHGWLTSNPLSPASSRKSTRSILTRSYHEQQK